MGVDQRLRSETDDGGNAVIMVTSAAPNEGKTTISLSLARAYALSGMSTLLIDCDLRKPSIHRLLGMESSGGLLDYLASPEATPLQDIIVRDSGSDAQVVLGSRRSDVPTDQLVSGRTFARLVSAARMKFDRVILDTPPVGPVVDGLYLAGMADAVVFVVRWSSTPQQEAKSAIDSVLEVTRERTAVMGIINQQEVPRKSYRGRYAGYYSDA
jgi:capsular exopolysaccharide synthesis family protein